MKIKNKEFKYNEDSISNDEAILINLCVETSLDSLKNLAIAKFGTIWEPMSHTLFIRNILLNMYCNFLNEATNHNVPNSLERNVEETISDIKKWFEEVKKMKVKETH